MKITLKRLTAKEREFDTVGAVFLDDVFACFALEDRFRQFKIPKSTRIPPGRYSLTLRTFGTHHQQYLKKYGDWHKGMIEVQDVPGFTGILIHVGNTAKDTEGCILVGDWMQLSPDEPAEMPRSEQAYVRIYPEIRDAITREPTYLIVED